MSARSWLRRAIAWLRRLAMLLSRREPVFSVAVAECAHDADPEALLRRLLLAVGDPQRFGEVLAGFTNCRGCSTAVLAQSIYTMAGMLLGDQDVDDQLAGPPCGCDHRVRPEVIAMRLALAFDSDDSDALGMTLGQVLDCENCVFSVILALVRANVTILDDTRLSWRPALERRLLFLLDQATGPTET